MPTTTARLQIPVPLSTDPANVPSDMLNLANALDNGGTDPNYDGAAVIVATPGGIGALPASPVVGTIYPVNSSPPYLLYYTGEVTSGTGPAPTGWRLVGQAGSNVANISNTTPGNSASVGVQPVWAPLDHQHSSLPWSNNQTTAAYVGLSASDGIANAYSRADHAHSPELYSGVFAEYDFLGSVTNLNMGSFAPLVAPGCSVTVNTGVFALVIITANLSVGIATQAYLGYEVTGASNVSPFTTNALALVNAQAGPSGGVIDITASYVAPVTLNPGVNIFTLMGQAIGNSEAIADDVTLTVIPLGLG